MADTEESAHFEKNYPVWGKLDRLYMTITDENENINFRDNPVKIKVFQNLSQQADLEFNSNDFFVNSSIIQCRTLFVSGLKNSICVKVEIEQSAFFDVSKISFYAE